MWLSENSPRSMQLIWCHLLQSEINLLSEIGRRNDREWKKCEWKKCVKYNFVSDSLWDLRFRFRFRTIDEKVATRKMPTMLIKFARNSCNHLHLNEVVKKFLLTEMVGIWLGHIIFCYKLWQFQQYQIG